MKINFYSNELPKNIHTFKDMLDFVKSNEHLKKENSQYELEINDSGNINDCLLNIGRFIIILKSPHSDEEFSDEELLPLVLPINEEQEELEEKIQITKDDILNDNIVEEKKENEEQTEIISECIENVEEEKKNEDLKIEKIEWMNKQLQNKILKYLINYIWIEEKFHIRSTLRNFNLDDIEIKSACYILKNYKEKTKFFLPKLALTYVLFNLLEKCPQEEIIETIFMVYLKKVYKMENSLDVLLLFSQNSFTTSLEKCLHYYSLLYLSNVEERLKEPMFHNFGYLELEKQKLETLFSE